MKTFEKLLPDCRIRANDSDFMTVEWDSLVGIATQRRETGLWKVLVLDMFAGAQIADAPSEEIEVDNKKQAAEQICRLARELAARRGSDQDD